MSCSSPSPQSRTPWARSPRSALRSAHTWANPTGDDLDYMHARFCSPLTGRFVSVDPMGGDPFEPQSWNGYSYVMNRPLNYRDPEGRIALPTPFLLNVADAFNAFRFYGLSKRASCSSSLGF
jgi:RHS repeat-associated protein